MANNEVGSQTEFCKCIKTRLQRQLGNENRFCPRCRKPINHQKNSRGFESQNRPDDANKNSPFSSSDNSNVNYETIKHPTFDREPKITTQIGSPDPQGIEEVLNRGSYNPSPRQSRTPSPDNNLSRNLRELSFSPVEVKSPSEKSPRDYGILKENEIKRFPHFPSLDLSEEPLYDLYKLKSKEHLIHKPYETHLK